MRIAMTAAPVLQNWLLAHSGREFDLWQACHEFPEKSSKIVPLGAPFVSLVCLQLLPPVPLARFRTNNTTNKTSLQISGNSVDSESAHRLAPTSLGLIPLANSLTGVRDSHRIRDIGSQVVGSPANQFNEEEACP
jgi:hypothetical protein